MRKVAYLMTMIFALALMSIGCEKENPNPDDDNRVPDKNALRISKIANNPGMFKPDYTFEYDADGRVIEISDGTDLFLITYNADNLPIEMVAEMENDYDKTIEIIWNENGYTTKSSYYSRESTVTYQLDSQGRIISIIDSTYRQDHDTLYIDRFEVRWSEYEMNFNKLMDDGEEIWKQTRNYNEFNNPMAAINIAILNEFQISYIGTDYGLSFQRSSCVASYNCENEGTGSYLYEFNESGYPTEVIVSRGYGDSFNLYFEYESD